ncbi:MAG: GTPase [Deltaproteobacteria bacterium]|nr:GTPase [Deltaproteobacteria bacterium]MBZ0219672.1 GTPase [Deltaproteobacteria bacterium]
MTGKARGRRKRIIILGAAGRDFHNFNVLYRDDPSIEVVAFTAAQIPFIEKRTYPPSLSGPLYPEGIRIYPEDELPELIKRHRADEVVFSYSDVSYEYVMRRAALAISLGAGFILPSAEAAMLKAKKPVISVSAVRTGCGKSGVTRYIGKKILQAGKRPVAIRHPMPYGDLERQRLQRFATREDLIEAQCTIEEFEEYEPLIESGLVVYAGVDYSAILDEAEKEGDIILWDGGNNDLPFIRPDFEIVVTDPLRPGHELLYYPGEANLRRAHVVVINKAGSAGADVELVASNARAVNSRATILRTDSAITVEGEIRGKKALVVEDGPTLTHGGMAYGAGMAAARAFGAEPVDPRPYAVGTIKETFRKYPVLQNLLPAMGYSEGQKKELQEIIEKTPADLVLIATPIDLSRVIPITKPAVRVRYEIEEMDSPGLWDEVRAFLSKLG